ncbi:MAG: GNAT family N-acetyltransferase [Gaiellaceae bacterium]
MRIAAADTLTGGELAAVFTAGYEGYVVPMRVDEALFEYLVDAGDLDLSRSRVALGDDGAPVGLVLLGVRGDRGWIGGLGVIPAVRRGGVGRALMEAVLADAPPRVTLEVIMENEPAIRLYERLGFVRRRVLEVWTLTAAAPSASARIVEPRPLGQEGLPWQREDASLPERYERLEVDGGAALVRDANETVSVLQLAAEGEGPARELLAAARARGVLRYVNVPEGEPASAALRSLGASLDVRQLELERAQMLIPPSVA